MQEQLLDNVVTTEMVIEEEFIELNADMYQNCCRINVG